MDLSKIIGELRLELQALNAAIVSMEELARVQSLPEPVAGEATQPDPNPPGPESPMAKRRRGRPPKQAPPPIEEAPSSGSDDSSA
jgi:hypothetical protein